MRMTDRQFLAIVKRTPLVSIDLIVKNGAGAVLLGLRRRSPAKGTWFVPGGRIHKDEDLASAFSRIALSELCEELKIENGTFLGCFEHRYPTNFANHPGIGTHYVTLAYQLAAELATGDGSKLPSSEADQHSEWRFMSVEKLMKDPNVHDNVKLFFT